MQVNEALEKRKSTRAFLDKPVEKEKIESSLLYNPVKNFGTFLFPKIIAAKENIENK